MHHRPPQSNFWGGHVPRVPRGIYAYVWAQNRGPCPFGEGQLGPHLTHCGQGRGLPAHQVSSWSIQPFGHSTPTLQTGQSDRRTDRTDNGAIAEGEPCYKRSPKNGMSWATFTPQPSRRASSHFGRYSFPIPLMVVRGRVRLGWQLITYRAGLPAQKTVTPPSRRTDQPDVQ